MKRNQNVSPQKLNTNEGSNGRNEEQRSYKTYRKQIAK